MSPDASALPDESACRAALDVVRDAAIRRLVRAAHRSVAYVQALGDHGARVDP